MKIYHMAAKINEAGNVSALCYARPRAIDLRKASWTIRPEAVTCRKCRAAALKGDAKPATEEK